MCVCVCVSSITTAHLLQCTSHAAFVEYFFCVCVFVCVFMCVCVREAHKQNWNDTFCSDLFNGSITFSFRGHLVLSQRAYYLVCLFLIWPNTCSFVLDVWDAHYQSVLGPNYAHARSSLKLISHHYHQLVWLWQVYFETCIFISEWDSVCNRHFNSSLKWTYAENVFPLWPSKM